MRGFLSAVAILCGVGSGRLRLPRHASRGPGPGGRDERPGFCFRHVRQRQPRASDRSPGDRTARTGRSERGTCRSNSLGIPRSLTGIPDGRTLVSSSKNLILMPDFYPGKTTYTQGQELDRVFVAGNEADFIFGRGTQIFPNAAIPLYGTTDTRIVVDTLAEWFEFGFRIDTELAGNSAAGWTDSGNYLKIEAQQSEDLVSWNMGKFLPCSVPAIHLGDGVWEYWGRSTVPLVWNSVMVDMELVCDRYGKSITDISLFRSTISLPNYPYAMPSQAATLQVDLRAAGYTGATVTSTSAALTATIYNHTVNGRKLLIVTQSGASVTAVNPPFGGTIPLPNYPYALPAQAAALQANLRSAGYNGAVVTLYQDPWTISLPNRPAGGRLRDFLVQFTPGDPYPTWDFYGNYVGLSPANTQTGTFDNVRDPFGNPLQEASKQFGRLKITTGSRYNAYL